MKFSKSSIDPIAPLNLVDINDESDHTITKTTNQAPEKLKTKSIPNPNSKPIKFIQYAPNKSKKNSSKEFIKFRLSVPKKLQDPLTNIASQKILTPNTTNDSSDTCYSVSSNIINSSPQINIQTPELLPSKISPIPSPTQPLPLINSSLTLIDTFPNNQNYIKTLKRELEIDFGFPFHLIISKIVLMSAKTIPVMFMPARLPMLIHDLISGNLPEYFFYSLLSCSSRYAWIIRTTSKIKTEHKYAEIAKKLISQNVFTNNPYYIWSTLLLSMYFFGTTNVLGSVDYVVPKIKFIKFYLFLIYVSRLAKKLKLNSIDSQKFKKKGKSYEELEFLRRIWWTMFISNIHINMGTSLLSLTNCNDISVNFPRNDFYWKFGGDSPDCPKILRPLNSIANTFGLNNPIYQDGFYFICDAYLHFNMTILYLNSRWLKKNIAKKTNDLKFNHIAKLMTILAKVSVRAKYFTTTTSRSTL
ncbi:hypothetical protein AYI69_g6542 [Smittium culicis]|uniref:Xylanolytic transcriptional activator regulatory domain-containing protein n=1 Tax=Smittium culicis TaxID=133412 RepID=A0A1R1XYA3_9FUNG|nr:hypothetical protein AYI69_g6542 [Smittium culicis]